MNIKDLKSNEIMSGFRGRIIHGSDFTWVYWEIDKGSRLSEHNHVNEQLMHFLYLRMFLTREGQLVIVY
jgi:quercetin dioxygenase-like cupin family protein